eukprot:15267400-Alexandrium_andersonii.AAC.1
MGKGRMTTGSAPSAAGESSRTTRLVGAWKRLYAGMQMGASRREPPNCSWRVQLPTRGVKKPQATR